MARMALSITFFSALLVLTSLAGTAPNLEKTLAVQLDLVEQQPYDAEARNDLGNLLVLAGREADAEEAYRRAIELDPQSTAPRFNLAVLLQQNSRRDEAAKMLQRLLEIDRYHGWAHYQLGMIYDHRGDRSRALESYARAFAYDPALTFATNNPHIIDNEHSTEALLLSQRYRTPDATRIPRHYSNPQRIAELMLEEMMAEAEAAAETAVDAQPGDDPEQRGGGDERPHRDASDVQDDQDLPPEDEEDSPERIRPELPRRGGSSEEDQELDGRDESSTLVVATPQARVLTPESIDESGRLNQAEPPPPPPPGSPAARRQEFEQRFLRGRSRSGDPSRETMTPPPPTETRSPQVLRRYRPGRASTGRLELELLPAEPGERYAAGVQRATEATSG